MHRRTADWETRDEITKIPDGDLYCSLDQGGKLVERTRAALAGAVLAGDGRGLEPAERALAAWAWSVARGLVSGLPAAAGRRSSARSARLCGQLPDWTIRIALPNGSRKPMSVP